MNLSLINFRRFFLFLITIYFLFFTFFDLNWGAPFYFNPDERNIATAVAQLNFTSNINPHFFAYGQLPIYLTYIIGVVVNFLLHHSPDLVIPFENAIIIGRLLSVFLSI